DKQLKSHPPKNVESEILREHIKKEREAAKVGKRPYYLKKYCVCLSVFVQQVISEIDSSAEGAISSIKEWLKLDNCKCSMDFNCHTTNVHVYF
ncbi:hypothetical protein ACJX0J_042225, partial [Zea mays]